MCVSVCGNDGNDAGVKLFKMIHTEANLETRLLGILPLTAGTETINHATAHTQP